MPHRRDHGAVAADWVTVATAAITGTLTLGGSWLTQRSNRRADEDRYARQTEDKRAERLHALYIDMAQHIEVTVEWLQRVTDEVTPWSDFDTSYPTSQQLITSRVNLYGSEELAAAWGAYAFAGEVVDEAVRMASGATYPPILAADTPTVVKLLEAIAEVKRRLRKAATID